MPEEKGWLRRPDARLSELLSGFEGRECFGTRSGECLLKASCKILAGPYGKGVGQSVEPESTEARRTRTHGTTRPYDTRGAGRPNGPEGGLEALPQHGMIN